MNEIWCLDCKKVFHDHQGHHCVHGWCMQTNLQRKNGQLHKLQKHVCESQLTFPVTEEESNYPNSFITELGTAEFDVSPQTNFTYLQTNSDFQLFPSSECASEKKKYQIMVCKSLQTYIESCITRETDVQEESINHPVSIFVHNLPLESSIRNGRIIVDNCGTSDFRSQFSTIEVSSISNSEKKHRDFTMASLNINSLVLTKTGLEFLTNEHKQKSNVKIDQQLSKNSQDHGEERKLKTEFESKIIFQNGQMVSKGSRLSEMSYHFSVSSQIVHDNGQKHNLEKILYPVTIKENKSNQQLRFSNMLSVKMTQDCTFTGPLNSHVHKLTFGSQNYHGDGKQFAATILLNPDTTESIQLCFADACTSVISLFYSLRSELNCSICQKAFRSKKYLKQHYKIHSSERPAVCSICQQIFSDKCQLKRHIVVHSGKKPYKCKICGTFFARKDYLGRHINIHMHEKPYKCDICSKLFARKDSLAVHIRIHTGEKPFKCDICRITFTQKNNLNKHVKRQHRVT